MAVYGVGEVLNRLLGFFLIPLFTAYLTPKEFGISAILNVIVLLVLPMFSLGLGATIGVHFFENNDLVRKRSSIWTSFTMLFASTVILVGATLFFQDFVCRIAFGDESYRFLLLLSILASAFTILAIPLRLYIQFQEKATLFVAVSVLTTVVTLGLAVVLVVFYQRGVLGLVESTLAGQAFSFVLFFVATIRDIRFRVDLDDAKALVKLGLPFIPSFAFLFVILHGGKTILQWIDGLESVGIYIIGFNLGFAMNIVISAFQSAWLPYFMSFINKREEGREIFGRIATYYVLGFGLLSVLFFIFARPVVAVMTQPPFHSAWQAVGFSAAAQFFLGFFSVLLPGVYFAKEVKYVALVQAVAAVLALILNTTLIKLEGLFGAGLALAFGGFSLCALQFAWNWHRKQSYIRVKYEWPRISKAIATYGIFIAMAFLFVQGSLLNQIVVSALLATAVTTAAFFMSTQTERQTVLRFLSWNRE